MSLFSSVSIQGRVDFAKSLAIMLKSGIAIDEALLSLAEQSESAQFKKIITRVRTDIENGIPLSVAFGREMQTFGTIFVSLVKAGEESGTLQANFVFLAEWLSRNADLKREVAAATLYPKLVFGAATLLGGCLAIFILPKLVPLFGQLHVELPLITRMLLAISLYLQKYWLFSVFGIACMGILLLFSNRVYAIRKAYHFVYIHMPFMGPLLRNYQLALITQLFGMLLQSGISINDSIDIVAEAVTNIQYKETIKDIQSSVVKGTSLSIAMENHITLFPRLFVSIVAVGEKSGTLVNSFEYLAEYYTKEVNAQAKKLPTIIEPLLLIFIAMMVGFVALAIIMPIYKLTGSITK